MTGPLPLPRYQDYLRGIRRAASLRVVVLALALPSAERGAGNSPRGYGGPAGWRARLLLLREAAGRFRDHRVLVQVVCCDGCCCCCWWWWWWWWCLCW